MTSRFGTLLVSCLSTTVLLACGGGEEQTPTQPDEPEPQVTTIEVSPDSAELNALDATQDFEATARDQNGDTMSGASFDWSVEPDSVASVDSDGTVTAEANGAAKVEAGAEGVTGSADLNVNQQPAEIRLTPSAVNLEADGDTATLDAEVLDGQGNVMQVEDLSWSTSNAQVASVTSSGTVTGQSVGSATIEAQAEGASGQADVEVFVPVGTVNLSPDSSAVVINASKSFTADIYDPEGREPSKTTLNWSLSDSTSASIDGDGTLTAARQGTVEVIATSFDESDSSTVIIPDTLRFTKVTGTEFFSGANQSTCALSTDGFVYCWGDKSPAIGNNLTDPAQRSPLPVSLHTQFSTVTSGSGHTCGTHNDGSASCWGYNQKGELGNGTTTSKEYSPVTVSHINNFALINAGTKGTCGITTSNDTYCWGAYFKGQLGNGQLQDQNEPTAVSGDQEFTTLSTAGYHVCAITTSNKAYCWGTNEDGELGTQKSSDSCNGDPCQLEPTPVDTEATFTAISAGVSGFTCAVSTKNKAYCWGDGEHGQLANGFQNTSRPTQVVGGHTFTEISTGRAHTCGLTPDETIYCWGLDSRGQLGTGSRNTDEECASDYCSAQPVEVESELDFTAVAAQSLHTCAITTDNRLYCWGNNSSGQLGIEEDTNWKAEPVPVLGQGLFE